jgi:hypothetical protein
VYVRYIELYPFDVSGAGFVVVRKLSSLLRDLDPPDNLIKLTLEHFVDDEAVGSVTFALVGVAGLVNLATHDVEANVVTAVVLLDVVAVRAALSLDSDYETTVLGVFGGTST